MNSWIETPEQFDDLFSFLNVEGQTAATAGAAGGGDIPEALIQALTRWALMYDVPFGYLVPQEQMLPPDSIRFFFLNYNDLFAMLDGALSVGRTFDVDYQHDAALIDAAISAALYTRYAVRPTLQGRPVPTQPQAANTGYQDTGFLLRSPLVKGWRGLEFQAYGTDGQPLTALRIETLGPDVLLGIYDGPIGRLEIAQPPEGLHYGFTRRAGGGYEKKLRRLDTGALYSDTEHAAQVVMRSETQRVVSLHDTAKHIMSGLGLTGAPNSALLALEMIQNPLTGVILQEPPVPPKQES